MSNLVKRSAFTLMELLVVLVIMAILAGLMMVGANAIRGDAKKKATEGILAACYQAMELHSAEKGGYPGAARHPGWWLKSNHEPIPGVAAVAGNAMVSEQPVAVYADKRLPMIYGCPSNRATLLGGELAAVTGRERDSLPTDNARYLDYVLGFGNAVSELKRQKALINSSRPVAGPDGPQILQGTYTPGGGWPAYLLWTPDSLPGSRRWEPGRIAANHQSNTNFNQPSADDPVIDGWLQYRLLGTAVYDAWGREVFYFFDKQRESFGFLSAGADGCLVWDPAADAVLDTPATTVLATGAIVATGSPFPSQRPGMPRSAGGTYGQPVGDDRWAGRDNVFVGMQ